MQAWGCVKNVDGTMLCGGQYEQNYRRSRALTLCMRHERRQKS